MQGMARRVAVDVVAMVEPAALHMASLIALNTIRSIPPWGHKAINLFAYPSSSLHIPSLMLRRASSHFSQHLEEAGSFHGRTRSPYHFAAI